MGREDGAHCKPANVRERCLTHTAAPPQIEESGMDIKPGKFLAIAAAGWQVSSTALVMTYRHWLNPIRTVWYRMRPASLLSVMVSETVVTDHGRTALQKGGGGPS